MSGIPTRYREFGHADDPERIRRNFMDLERRITTAAPAAGGNAFKYTSSRYYAFPPGTSANPTCALNRIWLTPFVTDHDITLDRLACRNTSSAGVQARMGIYNDTGNGFPGTLLLDGGLTASMSVTGDKEITISQALTSGIWWLAFVTTGSVQLQGTTGSSDAPAPIGFLNVTSALTGIYQGKIYDFAGAGPSGLPSSIPSTTDTAAGPFPRVAFRVA